MNRPTMSRQFASQVERTLEMLPSASTSRPVTAPHRVRTVVVTAVVAAVVVVATVLAIGLAPHHVSPASTTSTPMSPTVASCAEEQVRPFTCDSFVLKDSTGGFVEFDAWFDVVDGRPRFVVGESERLRILPITLTADGATAAPVTGWPPEQQGCAPDSECLLDQAVEHVFIGGARITMDGKRLHLSGGSAALTGTSSGRTHRYPQLGVAEAGGHIMLTYRDNGDHMAAANGGRLTYNKAGCLTNGSTVIVLPDTTVIHPDGSIDLAGKHIPIGGTLHLGGGEGSVPADQRCGTGNYFYGFGAGDS